MVDECQFADAGFMGSEIGYFLLIVGVIDCDDTVFAADCDLSPSHLQGAQNDVTGLTLDGLSGSKVDVLGPFKGDILLLWADAYELGLLHGTSSRYS